MNQYQKVIKNSSDMTFVFGGFDHQNMSTFYLLMNESQHAPPHHVSVVCRQCSDQINKHAHARTCMLVLPCTIVRTFADINNTLPSSNLPENIKNRVNAKALG